MTTEIVTGLVVVTFGLCLLGIVIALIFSSKFRADLTANPGKVSIFGASIEGVVIVLLTCALIVGMVISSQNLINLAKEAMKANQHVLSIPLNKLPSEVVEDEDVPATIKLIKSTVDRAKKAEGTPDIVSLVSNLSYSDTESKEIRTFPNRNIGPWTIGGKAQALFMSVPDEISLGKANWCPKNVDSYYEIRPRLGDIATGKAVTIKITNPITVADDCSDRFDYLQVTCDVAVVVLGKSNVTCDKAGKPKWTLAKNKKIPVWVTQVPTPE